MVRGRMFVLVVTALCVMAQTSAAARSGPSATVAHVYLNARVGNYAVTITVTKQGGRRGAVTLVAYLSRGGSTDQQTHSYSFTLAPGAAAVDSALGTARVKATLGSFGDVNLTLTGRGVTKTQRACSGPATLVRTAKATGRIKLRLGLLGTVSSLGRAVSIDRLQRSGSPSCQVPPCRRYGGTEIAGVNAGPNYVSVQSDGLGHTYMFATVSQQFARPSVSITHTRFALGGSLSASPGAGAGDRSLELTGSGPASGSLSFRGTGVTSPDRGCPGHTVLRVSGSINGQLQLPIDGFGTVVVSGDGSATAPLGDYVEQVS
jgi:hypothetical protein